MHLYKQKQHFTLTHRPFRYSLGTGLMLWLLTASGLNNLPETPAPVSPQPASTTYTTGNTFTLLNEEKLARQREIYQQAEHAFKIRRYETFRKLLADLEDYPLYPYLEYRNLMRQQSRLSTGQIDSFLDDNDNTVIGDRLRADMLRYYARQQRWNDYIKYYQPGQGTSAYCKYLQAMLQTDRHDEALHQVKELWLTGKSQPKACDSVFDAWEQAGHLSTEMIWKRIELAMNNGRTRLARYIAKQLPASDRDLATLWSKIHRKPELVTKPGLLKANHPMSSTILTHALKRMSRIDPDKAIELLATLQQNQHFSSLEIEQIHKQIGLSKARKHHSDAVFWLAKVSDVAADNYTQEWFIRAAIRNGDWAQVITAIEKLPPQQQSDLRWQFWWAYANEELGNLNDASGIYHYLAGKRSYYGFLAADRLNLPYSFEDRPLDVDASELASISHYPEAIRARELFKLNRIGDARREWQKLTQTLNRREKLAASQLAHRWGWHDRAIVTMGKTDYRDDIALRFPLPLKDTIESYSQQHSIETAWTYAIIRRESAFMQDARSSQGALGLMQIMPGTARNVARNMKVKYRGRDSLLATDTNIKLGTGYLGQMLQRLDNQALATAAYNAGPHRVEDWLPEHQPMDAIRWVETIPFTETREYVSNVLAYTIIYQHLMSNQYTRLTQRMPPVPAKNPHNQTAQNEQTKTGKNS